MKNPKIKVWKMLFALVLVLLMLVGPMLTPQTAEAACGDPKTPDYVGALSMMHSAAMALYPDGGPMSKNNPLGNAGMFLAVANSSCRHP